MQKELEYYFDKLWPICRSITGNGLRESLGILSEILPLKITEVPTGTQVFDWSIPKEWNIEDAHIITPDGKKIADFKMNNLHIINYSIPIELELSYDELAKQVHTIPEMPDAIPYITTYYKETWGFCLEHNVWADLPKEGMYKVVIKSTLEPGSLSYGECILRGETDEEILFSTYLCHPSMANNELSGPLAAAFLYKELASMTKRKYTYRFLFAPETIGVIAFLATTGEHLKSKLKAGYVLTCVGDAGPLTYKQSKLEISDADKIAEHILQYHHINHSVIPFSVGGSDERQYCSPGFNLPVGSLMRTPYQRFKEYHTSLDNKSFLSFKALEELVFAYKKIVEAFELNKKYRNKIQFCEPQLGKRGLYPSSVDPLFNRQELHRMLHFLSYADGETDLYSIAVKRNESMLLYGEIIKKCSDAGIIDQV